MHEERSVDSIRRIFKGNKESRLYFMSIYVLMTILDEAFNSETTVTGLLGARLN